MKKEFKSLTITFAFLIILSTATLAQTFQYTTTGDKYKDNERTTSGGTSSSSTARGSGSEIVATEPTHFFYNPRVHVNERNHLVVGLNEISFGLGANTQIQGSPWHDIGKVKLGIKHQMNNNMSFGVGLGRSSTLAFFTVFGVNLQRYAEFVLVPSGYITFNNREDGSSHHHNLGVGLGGNIEMNELFSFILEAGIWNEFYREHNEGYFGISGGLRIIPPSFPFFYFDGGVNGYKMIYRGDDTDLRDGRFNPYIDIGVCFVL